MARTDNIQINLNINGSRAISELNLLQSEAGKLREAMKGLRKGTQEYADLDKELKRVTKEMQAQQNQIGLNGMTIAQLTYKKNQLTAEIRKNLVPATDEYIKKTAELQKVNARLAELRGSVQQVSSVCDQLKSRFAVTFDVGNMLARGFDSLASTLKTTVGIAGTLSDKFADIQKSTGMSAKEVGIFAQTLQQMDTRTSLEGLLDIAKVGGQFGIAQKDLLAFTETIDKVNVALGDELKGGTEEVTKVLGGLRNVFTDIKSANVGMDILHIGNAINKLGAEGAATGDVIADFANRIGGVGITMGLTSGQVLGISAAMQEMNISAERGATAFTRILQEMAQAPDAFAQVAGKSAEEFKRLVNTNIYEAFKLVAQGANASSAQATVFAKVLQKLDIDGAGASEVIAKFGNNIALMDTRVQSASQAVKGASSVINEFDVKNQTFQATLDKTNKALYNFGMMIGQGLAFIIGGIIAKFGEFGSMISKIFPPARNLTNEFNAQKDAVQNLEKNVVPLLAEYDALASKSNKTKEEQERLKAIVEQVAQSVPLAVKEFDAYGRALSLNTDKAREFVKEQQAILGVKNRGAIDQEKQAIQSLQKEISALIEVRKQQAQTKELTDIKGNTRAVSAKEREAFVRETDERLSALRQELLGREGILKELTGKNLDASLAEKNKKIAEDQAKQREAQKQANLSNIQSQIEINKKQAELEKEAEQKRKEAREKSLEADKAREDLRIALIKDAYDREIAETTVATARKIEESNKEFAFIKANAQFNQAELATKTKEHNDYLALLEQQKADKIGEINARRIEEQRQREEEERTRTVSQLTAYLEEDLAREQAGIEAQHLQKQMLIEQQYAGEDEQFWARVEALRVAEEEARTAELDAQKAHLENKMFLLRSAGEAQSAEYKKLAAQLLGIDLEKNKKEVENRRRSIELQKNLEREKLDVAQGALRLGIDILSQDEEAKKKHATAIKLLTIADIQVGLQREIQGIWENANKNAINGVIPFWGQVFAGVQTGFATARAFMAIRKVSSTEYEKGGFLKVRQFATGGMLRGDGVLPSNTTHAQGGLHVIDNRTGKKVAEFEGQEGVIFSKTAIKNNPHLWQPLLHSSMYRQGAPVAPRQYRDGGTMGASPQPLPASLPTASPASLELAQANEDMRILIAETRNLIGIIAQNADSFKQVYISYYELEQKVAEMQRRRAENSSS